MGRGAGRALWRGPWWSQAVCAPPTQPRAAAPAVCAGRCGAVAASKTSDLGTRWTDLAVCDADAADGRRRAFRHATSRGPVLCPSLNVCRPASSTWRSVALEAKLPRTPAHAPFCRTPEAPVHSSRGRLNWRWVASAIRRPFLVTFGRCGRGACAHHIAIGPARSCATRKAGAFLKDAEPRNRDCRNELPPQTPRPRSRPQDLLPHRWPSSRSSTHSIV